MRHTRLLPLPATLLCLACGNDSSGPAALEITSMTPAADAAAVETGATVRVVFSQALDAATLTPANFRILTSATPIPLALSYDAGTRTARAAAPLVPGTDYTVEVTTGVRSATGVSLDATRQWSFATRDWAAVTVDAAGDVGWWTSVALESNGRRHVSYQDRDNLDLKYATCSVDCTTAGNWQAITLDAAGSAGYTTSIAVEAGGRVHLADFDLVGTNLEYFTCTADCATAVNWGSTVAAATGSLGYYASLALDGAGGVHVSHQDLVAETLHYSTCAADCTTGANWQSVLVDDAAAVGAYSSLALAGTGRLHVAYRDITNTNLKYATCAAACTTAANWDVATIDPSGTVGEGVSLKADGDGRLHVAYAQTGTSRVQYGTCAADCATAANWQTVSVPDAQGPSALALDADTRVHLTYHSAAATLGYATCAADCATADHWRTRIVDASINVGTFPTIALAANGRVHAAYRDVANADLKYIE